MTYVEWLRVRRVLAWTGIVMGALLVLLAVIQVGTDHFLTPGNLAGISIGTNRGDAIVKNSPSTVTTLPDGTRRTVIDNVEDGYRITIDDRGYRGKHIEIFEAKGHPSIAFAGVSDYEHKSVPGGDLYTTDTDQPEGLYSHMIAAGAVAMIIATLLGAPFARENDGHLEIALSKPISRVKLGIEILLVDSVGILATWVMTMIFLFAAHAVIESPQHSFGPYDLVIGLISIAAAFAWYAMICAATASMKRAYGAIQGIAWPVCGIVAIAANSNFGNSGLAQLVRAVATPFSWLVPFNWMRYPIGADAAHPAIDPNPYTMLTILLLLALVYAAIAVYQWRRVEA
ncbi:MAG: hypothetical protein JO199_10430 [Candidatus Eremiobacteraeota bacterium]|nr:hypothetical protein [Candidatus Eremiobacteraeota bacterium]